MKKRYQFRIFIILLIGFTQILTNSCSNEDIKSVPELTTMAATNITPSSATSGGTITNNGGYEILESGVCWSNTSNPSMADNKTSNDIIDNCFISSITGLNPMTQYYLKAYATNSAGTAYGNEIGIKTPDNISDLNDAIRIISVTPVAGLKTGANVSFLVTVSYKLSTLTTGILMIGFNNGDKVNSISIVDESKHIINQGTGQYTFQVMSPVKYWGYQGDFFVHVNLSPNPIPTTSWTPLSYDAFILIPKRYI